MTKFDSITTSGSGVVRWVFFGILVVIILSVFALISYGREMQGTQSLPFSDQMINGDSFPLVSSGDETPVYTLKGKEYSICAISDADSACHLVIPAGSAQRAVSAVSDTAEVVLSPAFVRKIDSLKKQRNYMAVENELSLLSLAERRRIEELLRDSLTHAEAENAVVVPSVIDTLKKNDNYLALENEASLRELAERRRAADLLRDSLQHVEEQRAVRNDSTFRPLLAARTNLLYDVALIPSIGVEYYIGKQWTLGLDYQNTWFYSNNSHRYYQCYGGYLTVRRYFGSLSETSPWDGFAYRGHHVGAYFMLLTYDWETGGKGYQSWKPSLGLGVEYGYSLPISRRLCLDFTLGIGYFGGQYEEYEPNPTWYTWRATKRLNWFGPTKAEVSLKWIIGKHY